jgi:hypothetical protein
MHDDLAGCYTDFVHILVITTSGDKHGRSIQETRYNEDKLNLAENIVGCPTWHSLDLNARFAKKYA